MESSIYFPFRWICHTGRRIPEVDSIPAIGWYPRFGLFSIGDMRDPTFCISIESLGLILSYMVHLGDFESSPSSGALPPYEIHRKVNLFLLGRSDR